MSSKKSAPATIAELMARESSADNDRSVFFNKPDASTLAVVEEDSAGTKEIDESITTAGIGCTAAGAAGEPPSEKKQVVEIRDRLRKLNMLIPGSDQYRLYSDEYRRIKRPLLSNAFGKTAQLVDKGNLILITSSIPGEGKTYSAINLALSIAHERDHTVLLVDCDVQRHGTSRMLGIDGRPGLVELLETESLPIGEVLLNTEVPSLSVISAGKQDEYVTELLASHRMQSVVEEIAERYDDRIIIFDAPPLLSTPQTHVLAELAGQVVFVVEAGKTPQSVVEDALELLPEGCAAAFLMNKNEGGSKKGGYYSGYYGVSETDE